MKKHDRQFRLVLGISAAVGVAIVAGAWSGPTAPNAPPVLGDACCSQDIKGEGKYNGLPELEWCLTQRKYDAQVRNGLNITPVAGCNPLGLADDPAVRDAAIPTASTPIKTFRLYFNVFRENGGVNPASTAIDVQSAVDRLNNYYAPWRIQFVYDWRYVNSTKYRYLASNEEGQMKSSYAVSPSTQLNVYVVDTGGVCWGTFPWMNQALTAQGGVVMHYYWFNAATPLTTILTHEVGHCLGLWHTFHGVDEVTQCGGCYEPAGRDAATGDTTGDLCSDTQPTLRNATGCADPAGTDPCSSNPWLNTPYQNHMSYSNQCAVEFTAQQAGRMHAWAANVLTGWMELPPPPAVPGTPSLTKTGTTINIVWADNSGDEDGFHVQREKKAGGNKWGSQTLVATVGADVTNVSDAPGTGTFRYRVRSFNSNGASAYSAWAQITN